MRRKHGLLFAVAAMVVLIAAQGTANAQEEPPPGCAPEDPRPECQGGPPPPPFPTPGNPGIGDGDRSGGGGGGVRGGHGGGDERGAGTILIEQVSEQEVESGDAGQTITITGGGDDSSQCAGVQGITNTGNASNSTGVLQYANEDAETEVDDGGNFEINPSQATGCDQRVNQAAVASSGL